ncbi:MAG: HAMP domain-containing protein, partial [Saprospiraceae bacterium]|nr:HAMP domain-containing protein [Saprospiraceae bacterium]
MELSFRNRIALFTATAAAVTIGVVFLLVYGVVYQTAYRHLDDDIRQEKEKFVRNLEWQGDSISIRHSQEEELESNNQANVNPTFLQLVSTDGRLLFRSPNLNDDSMQMNPHRVSESSFFNVQMGKRRVREGQFPILNRRQKTIGHLLIGISREESAIVLHNLRNTLLVTFPLLLIALYWATALLAFKGIAPVKQLIKAASRIRESNINDRLPVPANRDEIHQLAVTINELLERIERGVQREKQFTADASHEIRTPLTAIRGILEVLIRKKRPPEQYEEKIGHVIQEVDRLHAMSEQLLAVARMESNAIQVQKSALALLPFFQGLAQKWQPRLQEKNMTLEVDIPAAATVYSDSTLLRVMVDN